MGSVITGLSMSLDGFVAGRGDGPAHPLGIWAEFPAAFAGRALPKPGMGTWAGRPPGPARSRQVPAGLPIMAAFWSDDRGTARPSPHLST